MGKAYTDMLGIPVTTRATAGEGGAWGIAMFSWCQLIDGAGMFMV